jgi:oligopeptide transport system permease protein
VGRYLARRILLLIPVWLAVYTAVFLLFQITPGGPWDKEKPVPRETLEALNQKYGLDKPAFV